MKAKEVLSLYAAGKRNFHHVNLRGQSFKGKNLSGADFSEADIRGADFTKATLKGANFKRAIAGLRPRWTIALVIVSLLVSALSGFIVAWAGVFVGRLLNHTDPNYVFGCEITMIIVFSVFLFVTIGQRKGLGAALKAVAVAGVLAGLLAVALAVALAAVTGDRAEALRGALRGTGILAGALGGAATFVWSLAGAFAMAFTVAFAFAVAGSGAGVLAFAVAFAFAVAGVLAGAVSGTVSGAVAGAGISHEAGALAVARAVAFAEAFATTLLGNYIAWCALTGKQFAWIQRIAVAFAATGGTNFWKADLRDADFTKATLKNTNLSNAILNHTCWFRAQKVDQARVSGTILVDSAVQHLVVTKDGKSKSFVGLNLKGANLVGADLSDTDLTEAELSGAALQRSSLEQANLTKTQALETNFDGANLTGACLEAWNIDSTTQLNGAICDYVYLLNNQRERRPSSENFAPGEFTKLFQEVLNTVDLILRNGIDWEAFTYSFKKLQVEYKDMELSIRSLENKGDGVVVVKVNVPADVNKAEIHSNFTQSYEFALKAIEQRYQAELKSKDEQIAIYRQHQADLQEVFKLLASRPDNKVEGKLVVLKLGKGDFRQGFPVTLQVGTEGTLPFAEITGELSPALSVLEDYSRWQSAYRRSLLASVRIKLPETQVTNFSMTEFIKECNDSAESLRKSLNVWLNSESFRPVKERLLEKVTTSETIRVILQTENLQLRRLPWHLWNFFERYPKAEFALSVPVYERVEKSISPEAKVKVLAILGNSTGIDIQKDREILEQLPNAEVNFLVEPQRKELNHELWSQTWDILFFAGHSSSQTDGESGQIYINQTDRLSINQLRLALGKAIGQSLKLAIFNSCDGLGIAASLANLQIPQIIVMREPVPDQVAQEFLKNFLIAFAGGESLYLSVREAREKLEGLEDEFPCATWLPVICQNPAEVPKTWQEFQGS